VQALQLAEAGVVATALLVLALLLVYTIRWIEGRWRSTIS